MQTAKIILLAFLLTLPLVSAATTITIKTLPGHDVFVSVWDQSFSNQFSSPKKYLSDINGKVEHSYDGTTSPFGVLVIVKSFGTQKFREEFSPYNVGETVELELLPEDYIDPLAGQEDTTPVTSESAPPEQNVSQEETIATITPETTPTNTTNKTNFTGNAIFTNLLDGQTLKIVYYVVGAVFVLGMLAVIVLFTAKKIRNSSPPQYGMQPVNLDRKYRSDPSDKYLDTIEKEIDDVERQIEQYKKRNRLEDAQKRLEEKKKMLERIKSGDHVQSQRALPEKKEFRPSKEQQSLKDFSKSDQFSYKKRFY